MEAPACVACHQAVSPSNPPWMLLCQHLLCDKCVKERPKTDVVCPMEGQVTPFQELIVDEVLLHALSPETPSPRHLHLLYKPSYPLPRPPASSPSCQHERFGAFPCCINCGTILEDLLDVQDWTCRYCLTVNTARMFVCHFCSKTNERQRRKLLEMRAKSIKK